MYRFSSARLGAGVVSLLVSTTLCLTSLPGQTNTKGGTKGAKQPPPAATPKPGGAATPPQQQQGGNARAARGPLTKADVERLWKGSEDLLLNEIRLRGLGFEPEEAWLSSLNPGLKPAAAVELQKAIPEAPTPDAVAAVASELLNSVKAAAQKRDEEALKPMLHPELLAQKSKVYDLFDTTNYQNHTLGHFNPAANRRVGVQFFQLTTSHVERLHYVQFVSSHGKIVVRDVVTGPGVADQFLQDEKALALSKLDLVFRAFNDGDDAGLKNLCTPGLYEKLQDLSGGARLTRGVKLSVDTVHPVVSVPLDQKSVRVVARVGFASPSGRRIEFDTDFERIGNDLKVVRIRDTTNRVIAWDPNIDNYLNRRYGLPDGPAQDNPQQGMTDFIQFKGISTIRQLVDGALYAGDVAKLQEYSQELLESLPATGEGYGVRTAVDQLRGKFDDARKDAMTTLERGGVAYFAALRHKSFDSKSFWPVVLGITKGKIIYRPVGGDSSEPTEIELSSIRSVNFDKPSGFAKKAIGLKGMRPLLSITVRGADGKDHDMNFAAFGTSCAAGQQLQPYTGGDTACAGGGPLSFSPANKAQPAGPPTFVRADWQQNLQVIQSAIEDARKRGGGR